MACGLLKVRRMRLLALVLVPAAAACVGNTQRTVRAPHPGVPLHSGQALAAPASIGVGLSNVTDVVDPSVGNAKDSVAVPATQMRNELRFKVGDRASLGVHYEHGFEATSQQPDPTQAPVGDGDVRGYGMSTSYAFETGTPGFVIGTMLELTVWSVPYAEYSICTNCIEPFVFVDRGRANPMSLGIGVAPSYKSGQLTVFGGLFARNHPTTRRKEIDDQIILDDEDGDVRDGPRNLLAHAGLEYALSPTVSALVLVHQNLVSNPVQYGPGIGVGITAKLGN